MCEIISKKLGMIKGDNSEEMEADKSHSTTDAVLYDALVVPCGNKSAETMKSQGKALAFLAETFRHCKAIGALGSGIELLKAADLPEVEFSDGDTLSDQGVVTAKEISSGFLEAFKIALGTRHWDRDQKDKVPA